MTVCAVAIAARLRENTIWCEYLVFLGVYK